MVLFFLAYLVAIAVFAGGIGLLFRVDKRNILIAYFVLLIGLPTVFVGMLFVLKEPIQQGKMLSDTSLGPLLNLIAPPPDLYLPLAEVNLDPEKTEYTLDVSHKYLGNHALMVASPRPAREESPKYTDLVVSMTVTDGQSELFKADSGRTGQFWGRDEYGAFLLTYKVPRDLPVARPLKARVSISGGLKEFLARRGSTVLKIQKFSDE